MADKTSPPISLESWLEQVDEDPDIPLEFKNGAQAQLKLSSTSFSSGSGLNSTESLHLRVIWSRYLRIEHLRNLMRDDPKTGYTGYVSAENHVTASLIFNAKRSLWQSYFKELGIRKAEMEKSFGTQAADVSHGLAVPSQPLAPPRQCGNFLLVLYWQLLSLATDKRTPTDDELRRTSSISKPGPQPDHEPTALLTPSAFNRLVTPHKTILHGQTEQGTPTPGFQNTPQASSYHPARGGKFNEPATDEYYVNTALLELLHSIKLDVGTDFSSLDWLAKRLPLKLREVVPTKNPETGEIDVLMRELMEARLDGYLCRRSSPFEKGLNTEPLAILEAKPHTRLSALASIRRQEGAEMACWISQAGNSKTGLLQSSTSGRNRRLMISQDRHEIYLIVAEYGAGYEEYIRPSSSSVRESIKSQRKLHQTGSSTTGNYAQKDSLSAGIDSTPTRRDPSLLAGSPSYIGRVERKSIGVAAGPRSRQTQPTQAAPAEMNSSRTDEEWVPHAGDFLIMHEFGPFITTDPIHMEILIKRLIAFMLQLRGPQDRFVPERPGPEFLAQPGHAGPSTPNATSSSPRRTLRKSRSWPGEVEKSVADGVVSSAKAKWEG
ncbi:hypothetical protein INS49_005770 [Diaporthe citri]|uniref:uncharacterized protein n=1 Tax=Diaporthe citri TaxID=83186 RepID=UPI001C806859|nr:uncharacterized protein INS49_005770 [Diaporthe citri]KAG6364172.1 hypothetical protein INS49_005770 [Diaporthe citri]